MGLHHVYLAGVVRRPGLGTRQRGVRDVRRVGWRDLMGGGRGEGRPRRPHTQQAAGEQARHAGDVPSLLRACAGGRRHTGGAPEGRRAVPAPRKAAAAERLDGLRAPVGLGCGRQGLSTRRAGTDPALTYCARLEGEGCGARASAAPRSPPALWQPREHSMATWGWTKAGLAVPHKAARTPT